jgi:uncharacterized membrane protein
MSSDLTESMAEPALAVPKPIDLASDTTADAVRYGFIDLLRGFALVMMIETHVVNAYLPVTTRIGSAFFFWLSFLNGLVAPGFLFAAGFSLSLQADRRWKSWLRFGPPFWKQMRRLGFISLVAYYSHLQGFRLSRYLANWNDASLWTKTLQVDVLQCIVVSLLVVHALILILRRRSLLPWGAGFLALSMSLLTPWIWAQDFRGKFPLSMALFLNPHETSLFPVFPWICFVLVGTCAGCIFVKSEEARRLQHFMAGISLLGFFMIAGGLFFRNSRFTLPGHIEFFTTSPLYVIIRIGCILIFCALLYSLETGGRWIPNSIRLAGQESLLVYGVHLWLIFSMLRGKRMGAIIGLKAGYPGCFLMSLLIIIAMLLLAKGWHSLKKNYHGFAKFGQAATVLIMILIFVSN